MAILLLVVVVAFSALLVSVSMMQIGKLDRATEKLEERMVLEQIGEDFCGQPDVDYALGDAYTQYSAEVAENDDGSVVTLQVCPSEGGQPVLTVELTANDDGTSYTVTKWLYGE